MITMQKKQDSGIKRISINAIEILDNIRKEYDQTAIVEMARSIEQGGMHQPIKVYESDAPGIYRIIFGHRRYLAHKFLFDAEKKEYYATMDCMVVSKPDFQTLRIAQLVENWQRKNCSAQENEAAISELKKTGLTNKEIAQKTGKTEQWISSCLTASVARLDLELDGVNTDALSTPALAEIGRIPEEKRVEAAMEIISQGGSARAAESVRRSKKPGLSDEYVSTLDRVKTFINEKKNEGKIVGYRVTSDDEIIIHCIGKSENEPGI